MSGYIGAIPTPQATQSRDVYTATSNQTTFTTQGYTPNFVSVYLNGVHLARADFTATNGSDVVLASGATADDVVEIVSFGTFQSADALPLTGGTMTGDLIVPDGDLILGSTAVTATAAEINLIDGGTARGTTAVADGDGFLTNDGGTMRMTKVDTLATYMDTKVGAKAVVFPSNWASPTNTYTSSGTWSKGSLADDAYVWMYLLGSGGGGGSYDGSDVDGGDGGAATLLYGKASLFNGGAYVIGAAKAGNAGGTSAYNGTTPNASTFTLSSANGSLVFSTAGTSNTTSDRVFEITSGSLDVISNTGDDFTLVSQTQSGSVFSSSSVLPSGVVNVYRAAGKTYNGSNRSVEHSLFGGGNGGGYKNGGTLTSLPGTSEFSGAGGAAATTGTDGSAPGGGGGGSKNSSNAGGTGAAGNVRVYHV